VTRDAYSSSRSMLVTLFEYSTVIPFQSNAMPERYTTKFSNDSRDLSRLVVGFRQESLAYLVSLVNTHSAD